MIEISSAFAKGLHMYVYQAGDSLDRAHHSTDKEENKRDLRAFYEKSGTPLPSQVVNALTPEDHPPIDETRPISDGKVHMPPRDIRWRQFVGYCLRGKIRMEDVRWNFVRNALVDFAEHLEGKADWASESRGYTRVRLTYSEILVGACLPYWVARDSYEVEIFNQAYQFDGVRKPLPEIAPPNWLEHGPGSV